MPPKHMATSAKQRNNKRSKGRTNPPPAYTNERTFRTKYNALFKVSSTAPGGFVLPFNLLTLDDVAAIQQDWALWSLDSFVAKFTPTSATQGSYACRLYESVPGATPVVPTSLASVMTDNGKLKAATNAAENRITLRYRHQTVNEKLYTATTSTTAIGGDPGIIMYIENDLPAPGVGFFLIQVEAVFSFREPTQFAAFRQLKVKEIVVGYDAEEEFEEVKRPQSALIQRSQRR